MISMARLINLVFDGLTGEQIVGMLFLVWLTAWTIVNRDVVIDKIRERAAEEIRALADLYVPMFDLLMVAMDRVARFVDLPAPRVLRPEQAERMPRLVRDLVAERRAALLTVR